MVMQLSINLRIFKGGIIVRKAQYDDIYTEWIESQMFPHFNDYEEEEAYARNFLWIYR